MPIKSIAVIGAGAAGAAAAAALRAEKKFDIVRVFERRQIAGGTWIYDEVPETVPISPGALPPEIDRPLRVPSNLPTTLPHDDRQRFEATPIYKELTTNVPSIAMSFTDLGFPYGPFVGHWIPRQYIENYFAFHQCDSPHSLVLDTTVEDVTRLKGDRWQLTLRQVNPIGGVDTWWQESFDALIIANGHYSIPYIPFVKGLSEFTAAFPDRVQHSKSYRTPIVYAKQKVLIIGNSASGHDIATQLRLSGVCQDPIYVSRRSRSRWDGTKPPPGVEWKPVISEYTSDGSIVFADGSCLKDVDKVVYCTGYRASFPFWNTKENGRPLWDYAKDVLVNNYQHTFVSDYPTLAFIGVPRVLTFRSFEYQAIAVARLWSGRNALPMPPPAEKKKWHKQRQELCQREHRRFHQIDFDNGETMEWFRWLFEFAGLPLLEGVGRFPPVLDSKTRWFIDNVKKYPEHGGEDDDKSWEFLDIKDSLHFI